MLPGQGLSAWKLLCLKSSSVMESQPVLCALCFCPFSDSENRDCPPVRITSPWLCQLAFQGGTGQLTACLAVSRFHHSAGSWALYGAGQECADVPLESKASVSVPGLRNKARTGHRQHRPPYRTRKAARRATPVPGACLFRPRKEPEKQADIRTQEGP